MTVELKLAPSGARRCARGYARATHSWVPQVAPGFALDEENSIHLPSLSEFRSLATQHWLRVRAHGDEKDARTWSRLKRIVDQSWSGVQQLARTAAWWA